MAATFAGVDSSAMQPRADHSTAAQQQQHSTAVSPSFPCFNRGSSTFSRGFLIVLAAPY